MKTTSILSAFTALVVLGSAASAQSDIYGMDVRNSRFFKSDTANFVGNFTPILPGSNLYFALDFDQSATTLWGVANASLGTVTFDLTTGLATSVGVISGLASPTAGVTAITCDVAGVWYLCQFDAAGLPAGSMLYKGDIATGVFTQVGLIDPGIIIDIAIDSLGNMYGNSISNDSLYRINTSTGAGTLIGATGQATNFAQGMDFDWSTDTLYATNYIGGGVGNFVQYNLLTGFANIIVATTPLNAEMEMAVKVGAGAQPFAYCTSKITSNGCTPSIGSVGPPSATAGSGFLVNGTNFINNKSCLLFYGNNGQNSSPFQGGTLCVAPAIRRTPGTNTGGNPPPNDCSGAPVIDMNLFAVGGLGGTPQPFLVNPGAVVNCQWWGRDPGFAAPNNTQLSNGLEYIVGP